MRDIPWYMIVYPTDFPSAQNKIDNHVTTIAMNTTTPRSGSRGARGLCQPPSRSAMGPVEHEDQVAVRRDVLLFYTHTFTRLPN